MPSVTPTRRMTLARAILGSGYRSHAAMSKRCVGQSRQKIERHTGWRYTYACRSRRTVIDEGITAAAGRAERSRSASTPGPSMIPRTKWSDAESDLPKGRFGAIVGAR
jgi:hypothetical protein